VVVAALVFLDRGPDGRESENPVEVGAEADGAEFLPGVLQLALAGEERMVEDQSLLRVYRDRLEEDTQVNRKCQNLRSSRGLRIR
jgi:hypothetical protein